MTNCPTDFCNSVPNVFINRFDPVEGLVEYVNDIKPFHTKVVEVLIEYVHCDDVNVTIDDKYDWIISIVCPSPEFCPPRCEGGFGEQPWDGFNSLESLLEIKRIEHGPPSVPDQNNNDGFIADGFVVAGNVTAFFTRRDVFEVKFSPVPEYNKIYTVLNDTVYDATNDETVIRVLEPVFDYEFLKSPNVDPIGRIKVSNKEIPEITFTSAIAPLFPAVGDVWWQVVDDADPQDDENLLRRWTGTEWKIISCFFIGYDIRYCEFVDDWALDVHFGETFTITQNAECAPIVGVDQFGSCITVLGDQTKVWKSEVLGQPITFDMAFFITQSTGNNGMYVIESIVFNASNNTTTICTKNPIPDVTVDGFISCVATITLQDFLEVRDMENVRNDGYEHPYEHSPILIGDIIGVSPFVVAGNQTSKLINGELAFVKGSTGNDGVYTISSFVYNVGPDTTTIEVVESIPDLTPDGTLEFIRSFQWRPEAFDFSQPTTPIPTAIGNIWWRVDNPNNLVDPKVPDDKTVFRWNGTIWVDITPLFRGFSFHAFDDFVFDATWDQEPFSITHNFGDVAVDVVNNAFDVYGGNFIDHFTNGPHMTGVKVVSGNPTPPGVLPTDWVPTSFPILTVDAAGSKFIVIGDQTSFFLTGLILYIQITDTNLGYFTIIGSTFDVSSNTTSILVAETVNAAGRNLGVIVGAVYNAATFTTKVRVQQPVDTDVEALQYTYFGPLRITTDILRGPEGDADTLTYAFKDGFGITGQLTAVPDLYQIQFTDEPNNCFVLEPIIDPTTGVFVDLSDSFSPLTRFRITGSFNLINNFAPPIGAGIPPEWTVLTNTFNSGTGTNTVCVVENVLDGTIPFGAILREPFIVGSQLDRTADTSFLDDLTFTWGQTIEFPIILTNQGSSFVEVAGDQTGCILSFDEVNILGSDGNDGMYEVTGAVFIIGLNVTRVGLHAPVIPNIPAAGLDGILRLNNIDITNWFQYTLKSADGITEEFVVNGNALADLPVGTQFRIFSTTSNNGIYTVAAAPIFDGIATTIPVLENILVTETGGILESYRDNGIRLQFFDSIGVEQIGEIASGQAVLTTGGSFVGAWDSPAWDVGAFDESLSQLIQLYDNTF